MSFSSGNSFELFFGCFSWSLFSVLYLWNAYQLDIGLPGLILFSSFYFCFLWVLWPYLLTLLYFFTNYRLFKFQAFSAVLWMFLLFLLARSSSHMFLRILTVIFFPWNCLLHFSGWLWVAFFLFVLVSVSHDEGFHHVLGYLSLYNH